MTIQGKVILFPTVGMGHLIPMAELAKQFIARGFSVTIAVPTPTFDISATIDPFISLGSATHPSISFHRLPKVVPSSTKPQNFYHFETLRLSSAHLLEYLEKVKLEFDVRALVVDMFCVAGVDVGEMLGIPTYFFFPSNACILATFLSFPSLQANMKGSFRDLGDNTKINLPGLPPISVADLPDDFADRTDVNAELMSNLNHLWRADGIIINTYQWLEKRAVDALTNGVIVPGRKTPPVYCAGPMISYESAKDHDCLLWLDTQPEKSVVFLCFGSSGSFTKEQIHETAVGLERSGQRFLWVLRSPPVDPTASAANTYGDVDALLPEGFLDRTRGRGLVIGSWAPQREVLAHAAVGAFVSHCGWNSSLEAVAAGVALVCWPLCAEQRTNKVMLVEEAKVAVAVDRSNEELGIVKAEEIERKVRLVMECEEIRKRVAEAKEMAAKAWTEDGTTTVAWTELVRVIMKKCR